MTPAGFPHSDTPGSTLGCQLPRAYRRLPRPSSALDAKASTMCPSQLVTHTTNPHHHHNPNPATATATAKKATATATTEPRTTAGGRDRRCTQHATKEPAHPHHNHRRGMPQQTSNHTTPQRAGAAARCSRPLSRSQTTTPPTNKHSPRCTPRWREPRTPHPHRRNDAGSDVSEPQQCA